MISGHTGRWPGDGAVPEGRRKGPLGLALREQGEDEDVYEMNKEFDKLPRWKPMPFSKVAQRINHGIRTLKSQEYRQSGKYPIVDQGQKLVIGYADDEKSVFTGPFPVIVFGDHTKIVKYIDFPFSIGADGVVILSVKAGIDPKFLYYLLLHTDIKDLGYSRHYSILKKVSFSIPPLAEQKRIAAILNEQMAAVERARKAAQERLKAAIMLPFSLIRNSIAHGGTRCLTLDDCLVEVKNGVGTDWQRYRLVGATREGIAPAKEGVGKNPERYKLVDPVTVFYNPMRILLGSIAMVDENNETGITSPDYVVVKGKEGILDTRWFYYWFRSSYGAHLIDSLTRGAVRERVLFNRLCKGKIVLPNFHTQKVASEKMKEAQKIAEAISQEIMMIDALPSALIRRAFNGEI
ncbi:MAG: restriction endonuclease subunit S [bacterium]